MSASEIDLNDFQTYAPITLHNSEKIQIKLKPKGPIKVISIKNIGGGDQGQLKTLKNKSSSSSSSVLFSHSNLINLSDFSISVLFLFVCDEITFSGAYLHSYSYIFI
jgi:hypothetical protein